MDKGFNTEVENARKELAKLIGSKLQMGIPVSVVSLIMESILVEIRSAVDKTLQQENEKYNELNEIKNNQVEWTDPVNEVVEN